ncbi:CRISPR-associated helicase Cas3' [Herbivorax sp. ANBcel31]|uniref:CRISPR-associated helicase Cas3' n=1 Tax=Herbivorax sp. ANBcel31 TaxID=3069754 RepID=UPI0027B5CC3A|nr:CRISPR-associated helicase Cas3' [Herbivorax sp. ANBcel31]MDQ2085337.1 CRISPR-associated helicase Cas3' [Herbivorax sp. ANBcel31]
MLLSHPDKRLEVHLSNVFLIGESILNSQKINFDSYSIENIKVLNRINLLTHDLGKATPFFQKYIRSVEDETVLKKLQNDERKRHGLLSGVLSFIITNSIMKDERFSFLSYILVSKHHGELQDFTEYISKLDDKNINLLIEQFKSIDKEKFSKLLSEINISFDIFNIDVGDFSKEIEYMVSRKMRKKISDLKKSETYLLLNYLFSILVFSDKLEAIYGSEKMSIETFIEKNMNRPSLYSSCVEKYVETLRNKNIEMAKLRNEIYSDVVDALEKLELDRKILSINLPTGAGKTLAVLKIALRLKERIIKECGYNPKIIYTLPFTSIIEQNFDVFSKVLRSEDSNVLIKHHYLSEKMYKWEVENAMENYSHAVSEHFIDSWESEIVVSTFVQLLHSIFTNRNRKLKKFHNISNSIIILDEVQNIPFRYWNLVKEIFKGMSKYLNCYFIFMTATMPLIFSEEEQEIFELAKNKNKYFNMLNRIIINTNYLQKAMTIDEYREILYEDICNYKKDNFLIVVNTIKTSIEIYKFLKEEFEEDAEIYYLSTNIIPKERLYRIEKIKKSLNRKIIVSTQMIEAGVDIDIERVYRDFAPMDSINQTAGRCNREWGGKKGIVTLVSLINENHSDRLFASYIYDNILLEETKKVLQDKSKIEERDIFNLAKQYYEGLKSHGRDESNELIKEIDSLNYSKAFDKRENESAFELIEEKFKTVDVYVEIDGEAEKILGEYQNIKKIKNRFERKKKLNSIKKDFYKYVLSLPEYAVKVHMDINEKDITVFSKNMIFNTYDKDTGFKREIEEDYFF